MTAASEAVRELSTRTLSELNQASNYFTHTQFAWRAVQGLVRRGEAIRVLNDDTGDVADGESLTSLAQRYTASYLSESIFQHYVSLFEDFTFGLIGQWLMTFPRGIVGLDDDRAGDSLNKSDRTVPLALITDNPDRESILRAVIDRELDRLKYRRLSLWFDYLERRAQLGSPSKEQIEHLAEIKAVRDVLVHNRGVINAVYLSKAGARARHREGERVLITEPRLRGCWQLIADVVRDTSERAVAKLA